MAKVGGKTGSGQGRVRKLTNGIFARCVGEKNGLRCIQRNELCYPKEFRGTEQDYVYNCGKKDCPIRPKWESGERIGQQKQIKNR